MKGGKVLQGKEECMNYSLKRLNFLYVLYFFNEKFIVSMVFKKITIYILNFNIDLIKLVILFSFQAQLQKRNLILKRIEDFVSKESVRFNNL